MFAASCSAADAMISLRLRRSAPAPNALEAASARVLTRLNGGLFGAPFSHMVRADGTSAPAARPSLAEAGGRLPGAKRLDVPPAFSIASSALLEAP